MNKIFLMLIILTKLTLHAHDGAENYEPDLSKYSEVTWIDPELLHWAETIYPGTEIAGIFGNPKEAGKPYTIRLKLPANYVVKPHYHTQDEYMTVISGSLNVGIGMVVDQKESTYLPAGGAVGIPGKVPHYAWTTEEMVMQIHAMGPRDTCFVGTD